MPTRKQIRERTAKSLGLFLSLGTPDASPAPTNTIASFGKIVDNSVDNERFRWSFLYDDVADEYRMISSVVASSGQATVSRAFTASMSGRNIDLYGLLSPHEWNTILNEQVLPDLFYLDRATLTLTAGTAEYNATASISWLTDLGQIIRLRYRDVTTAAVPVEAEAAAIYPQQAGDGVVKILIPNAAFPANAGLLIEARHYYSALAADANSVNAPEKLVEAVLKHEGLKQIFQTLGPAAKAVFGQAMVLAERDRSEQEMRWLPRMPRRDLSSEDDPMVGEAGTGLDPWGW